MKNITNYIKTIALFCILAGAQMGFAQSPCQPSFTYSLGANGLVNFFGTAAGYSSVTPGNFTYWYGQGSASNTFTSGTSAFTYTANGTYTVTLMYVDPAMSCSATVVQTITIGNASGCLLNANTAYMTLGNGAYAFSSASTGTTGSTTYTWNFGDGGTSNSVAPNHTYAANGLYVVSLTAANSATCTDTKTVAIYVNSVCNLAASFIYSASAGGVVSFSSTSTGTNAGVTYNWNFGYGGGSGAVTGNTFPNGIYTVALTVSDPNVPGGCSSTSTQTLAITNNSCSLAASFSLTASGTTVNFASTSTGTTAVSLYDWSFGDNTTGTGIVTSHVYSTSGVYTAWLKVHDATWTCVDSVSQTFTVPPSTCIANANFSMVPTATAQYWNAVPNATNLASVVNAQWSWGDGSVSNSLYTSHQYSAANVYFVCLTMTLNCGATDSYCNVWNIYKTSQDMTVINISVVDPNGVATGIANNSAEMVEYAVSPNPSNGNFSVNMTGLNTDNVQVNVYNLVGELVYSNKADVSNGSLVKDIQLNNASNGVYFVKVNTGNNIFTKKVVISKQ